MQSSSIHWVEHSKELLDWVTESGKKLTTIYITHAHGDHFFGLKLLLSKDDQSRLRQIVAIDVNLPSRIPPNFSRYLPAKSSPGATHGPQLLDGGSSKITSGVVSLTVRHFAEHAA
jgi:glyoxylase-like metal-dependent hydrolase (beta-lactamase superfamily II)